ncbi:MAG: hypothetical protein OHK005_08340 [Candidatus Methylacidiphilales bacterium]
MFLTGIADEAGKSIHTQIRAHQALGWTELELRDAQVGDSPAANAHDLPEAEFDQVAQALDKAGIHVFCFSSKIANWGKKIDEPFESSLEEARRAIPRMKRLGTRFIRIMSFAVRPDTNDQMEDERFRRLRELVAMFTGEGLVPLHENCMNYGGMGWTYTMRLLEEVPGLKLVFDTGNPVFADDRTKPEPWPKQSAFEFYQHVKEHIAYVHIKDGVWDPVAKKTNFCFPGEGQGDVKPILEDLLRRGYDGGISIEPHMGAVYHDPTASSSGDKQFDTYVEYGRRLAHLIDEIKAKV